MHEDGATVRVEAFSDGVFGIAMTLLVIEIKVPGQEVVGAHGLGHALIALWPSYLAFMTSFATILAIWVHHHWLFSLITRNDHAFLYWNGLLLFFVSFVPFPTALLAEYLLHPDARIAANLYTGTFLAISLAFDGLWRHASRKLLAVDATKAKSRGGGDHPKVSLRPAPLSPGVRLVLRIRGIERRPVPVARPVLRVARHGVACREGASCPLKVTVRANVRCERAAFRFPSAEP